MYTLISCYICMYNPCTCCVSYETKQVERTFNETLTVHLCNSNTICINNNDFMHLAIRHIEAHVRT